MRGLLLALILALIVSVLLPGCVEVEVGGGYNNSEQDSYRKTQILFNGTDTNITIDVEVAMTPEEIRQGLMYRESLDENKGMLFAFEKEGYRSFWMKNTLIPLDIIFVNQNMTIIDIKENFQPCKQDPCESYTSKQKALFAVEVDAGFAWRNNISLGDTALIIDDDANMLTEYD
ncbi:DUF192 domain-containing protein [candidate division KSB1 bacterium]